MSGQRRRNEDSTIPRLPQSRGGEKGKYLVPSAGSKGLTKRHSALQKAHYLIYRTEDKAKKNLIKRLKTRIRRNEAMIKRKAKRNSPLVVKVDVGAINALKRITNK